MPSLPPETSASPTSTTTDPSVAELLKWAKKYVATHGWERTHSRDCAAWHAACLVSRMADALHTATVANECYAHSLAAALRDINSLRATGCPEKPRNASGCMDTAQITNGPESATQGPINDLTTGAIGI